MSFFKSLKRGLGFSDDDMSEDDVLFADTAEDIQPAAKTTGKPSVTPSQAATVEPPTFDKEKQAVIFEKIVDVFNQSLPPFLSASIDRQAQIKYLRDALDSGVKDYLDSLAAEAQAYCENRWQQTRESMASELEALKTKAGDIEKKSADMQQKQLSSDRQRRALSDRVHDLESQLASLEAEREQLELENRSLLNRIKVVGVQQEDVDSARTEIERLNQEIKRLRENPAEAAAAETDALKIQIDEMTNGIDSLKEQNRVCNQMLEEMRKNLASANKRIADRDQQIAKANETIQQYSDTMEKKMVEVDAILSENKETIKNQRIAIAQRDSKIDALNETISHNLKLQAKHERELRFEIDNLKKAAGSAAVATKTRPVAGEDHPVNTASPLISEDDLSAIEKTFESEDWFTKNPPAETPSMRPDTKDEDFGYKEPPRRNNGSDHNPSQLSLF